MRIIGLGENHKTLGRESQDYRCEQQDLRWRITGLWMKIKRLGENHRTLGENHTDRTLGRESQDSRCESQD